ncbi:hypothetical protein L3X38_012910 [Prunus dulcis]|uniref:Receptor-like protein 12 n=1 Tax=Prunus dulcis TaxID=3755 RepID=A0AAD4WK78_PRUDU|nr:hypothetical protein L3X38_012910 [Prunus dulcis]
MGQLPRSLANCVKLEYLVLSNNQFSDVFPIWLGTLPELKLLAMRHNGFNGVIGQSRTNVDFPKLRILDLSYNNFRGKIPEFIGNLTELRSLNISNNILTGSIPSSLGKLTNLESLDLSQNKLSGQIPQQLTQLSFLETFSVSHNNLIGPIPQGTQLTSFNCTSYEGNLGLCGDPLPNKCGNQEAPQQPFSTEEDSDSGSARTLEFDLIFGLAGVGSGLVVGVVLADVVVTRRQEFFLKIVGMVRLMIWKR